MQTLTDEHTRLKQMAIVERFEGFMNYMYPIALNIPRAHYVARYRRIEDGLALSRFIASWRGHAQWANSFNLLNKLGVA